MPSTCALKNQLFSLRKRTKFKHYNQLSQGRWTHKIHLNDTWMNVRDWHLIHMPSDCFVYHWLSKSFRDNILSLVWNTSGTFCVCCRKIQTLLFVLLFCFSSPCQRPLSVAHPAWPQPVPTVYCDCHQAYGGPNKGGSVPIVLPRFVNHSLGTNSATHWGLVEEHLRVWPHQPYIKDKGVKGEWDNEKEAKESGERKVGRCIVTRATKTLSCPLSETAVM